MSSPHPKRFTFSTFRAARVTGEKVSMLTCYDFTTAKLMQEAGVQILRVGDSAANFILGQSSTIPISLDFLIELTAAVKRGAPNCLVVGDMPFGSYHGSVARGVKNVTNMVKLSGCDCVKLEATASHLKLIRQVADAGVAVMAHLGLRPQSVGILGGYKIAGRTADEAMSIVGLAVQMQEAGAASILLEAVAPEVSEAVVQATNVPVIGCGAGPACHGSVVVMQDIAGLTAQPPRFAPRIGDLATPMKEIFAEYARRINKKEYPAVDQQYEMPADERSKFLRRRFESEQAKHRAPDASGPW
ncbi:3-methyl-2-oxobutanoate hydroxymethyltransferase [soil metagenome]